MLRVLSAVAITAFLNIILFGGHAAVAREYPWCRGHGYEYCQYDSLEACLRSVPAGNPLCFQNPYYRGR